MTTTEVPVARCACGAIFECATNAPSSPDVARPKPGDPTVCFECAAPYVFDEALLVQPLDVASLEPDLRRQVQELQAQIRAFRVLHPVRVRS